jgi:uncharacterized protein YodC (DUF2158 family)
MLNRHTFKLSDLKKVAEPLNPVVLKSGGLIMSLDHMDGDMAVCTWKDSDAVHIAKFDIRCLYNCTKND